MLVIFFLISTYHTFRVIHNFIPSYRIILWEHYHLANLVQENHEAISKDFISLLPLIDAPEA